MIRAQCELERFGKPTVSFVLWVFEVEARALAARWGFPFLPILTFDVGKTKLQDPAKLRKVAKELFGDVVSALTTPVEQLKEKYLARYKEVRERYLKKYGVLI